MLDHAIAVLGIVVGLLGLTALWIDPQEAKNKRKFLVIALGVTVVVEGAMLGYDYKTKQGQDIADAQRLELKERQLMRQLCPNDLDYDEIYETANMGWSDEELNNALDDLMQSRLLVTVHIARFPIPNQPSRDPVPVRFYHLEDRSQCSPATK